MAEVRLPVPENELRFIQKSALNQDEKPAVVLSSAASGNLQMWQAYLERSEGVVSEQSRMVYMVARYPDPYGLKQTSINHTTLRFGTYVTANIAGEPTYSVKIPRHLINENNQVVIAKESDSTLEIKDVSVYRYEYDDAFVVEGLSSGDQIVTTAIENPLNGMKVEIEQEDSGLLSQPVEAEENTNSSTIQANTSK